MIAMYFILQAGLRILHIDQANYDLNEVAYFDVNDEERVEFSGSWGNYPYFPSGMYSRVFELYSLESRM